MAFSLISSLHKIIIRIFITVKRKIRWEKEKKNKIKRDEEEKGF